MSYCRSCGIEAADPVMEFAMHDPRRTFVALVIDAAGCKLAVLCPKGRAIAFGGLYKEYMDEQTGESTIGASIITLGPHPAWANIPPDSSPRGLVRRPPLIRAGGLQSMHFHQS